MEDFVLDIFLPDKKLYKGTATQVIVPAEEGELGILSNHMPLIAKLRAGEIKISLHKEADKVFNISGGYLEMLHNHCTILANTD